MSRIPIDKTMLRTDRAGLLRLAPGRDLYVYEHGTTDEATGYTTEDGGVEVTYPLEADAQGRFNAWYPPGPYDLHTPGDDDTQFWLAGGLRGAQGPPSPETRLQTLAILGDSIVAQNGAITGIEEGSGAHFWPAVGWLSWAQMILGQRLTWIANAGVGGEQTSEWLARYETDILGLDPLPGYCIVGGPTNNIGEVSSPDVDQTIADLTEIHTALIAAGIRPIQLTITPSSYMTTDAQKAALWEVNNWIKVEAPATLPGLIAIDVTQPLIDPATGMQNDTYFIDDGGHVHPNNRGAFRMGREIARALENVLPPANLLSTGATGNLVPNSEGAGGSLSTLPTDWAASRADTGGALSAVDLATVPTYDGSPANWIEVSAQGETNPLQLYAQNEEVGTDWDEGDEVEGFVEFETDDDWENIASFQAFINFHNNLGSTQAISARSADGDMPEFPRRGVMRTPPMEVPVGATRIQAKVVLEGSGGAYTGTFRIRRFTIRKVS